MLGVMSVFVNVILLIIVAALAVFFIYKIRKGYQKPGRIKVDDPVSQDLYDKEKNTDVDEEEKSLSVEERIELSWQFLIGITEQVLNYFSDSDKKVVYDAGKKLAKNGMQYHHDVDQEVKIIRKVIKSKSRSENKKKESVRSR